MGGKDVGGVERRANSGSFAIGGRTAGGDIGRAVFEAREGESVQLGMMRWVRDNRKSRSDQAAVKAMRMWMERDTKGFMQELGLLEEAERRGEDHGRWLGDEGSGACLELLDRLLSEWEGKS